VPKRKPPPPDEKPQFERFLETVRKVEAGETDEELERALDKITPPKGGKLMEASARPSRPSEKRRAS
jgi:hypothetical protein